MTQATFALDDVGSVTDQELIARVRRLNGVDQKLNAQLIAHLGEVDARGLYREHACASMFVYCVEELHMSEAQAYLRIQAARLGRRFPAVLQRLAQGSVHLTALKLLGPHLTADNHLELLERSSGKGKREVELLVAAIAPKPDVPSRMRKLPEASFARPTHADATQAPVASASAPELRAESPELHPVSFALEAIGTTTRASAKALSPGRFKLEFTAGQALHDKLEQLQDLLRHQVPDGDLATIVERAVDMLICKTMKERFAQSNAPRKPRSIKARRRRNAPSRYVPRAVVREVHQRDSGQCTFVSVNGKRCSERGFLEVHHEMPYARGGTATPDNLRLVCRSHNALFADRDFGREFMLAKQKLTREGPKPNSVRADR
jgi:hypothetical protein